MLDEFGVTDEAPCRKESSTGDCYWAGCGSLERQSESKFELPTHHRKLMSYSCRRRVHTPDEFTLEMKVDVEEMRMEIILSQPASPQCDPLPRRAALDTRSEEPGTLPRLPAIGTESDGPGILRTETSMEEEGLLPFETSIDGVLNLNFTSTEQECVLLYQPDVEVDDEKEATVTSQHAAAREEFASPTEKRQQ